MYPDGNIRIYEPRVKEMREEGREVGWLYIMLGIYLALLNNFNEVLGEAVS